MANYPVSVWSPTTKSAGQTIQPSHINDGQDEVVAIETGLLSIGTFTPTLVSAGGGTPVYSNQIGLALRVGKAVPFYVRVTLTSVGTLAAGGLTIAGLPLTSNNTANSQAPCFVGFFNGLTSTAVFMNAFVNVNATTITLNILTAAATGVSQLNQTDISNTFDIIVGGVYFL